MDFSAWAKWEAARSKKQTDGVKILTRTHQDTWLDPRFAAYIDWLAQQGNTKSKTLGLDWPDV